MRLCDLTPGDEVSIRAADISAIFVGLIEPHPLYPGLALVVWYMTGGPDAGGWSHDALSPAMELAGQAVDDSDRDGNLRRALLGGAQ